MLITPGAWKGRGRFLFEGQSLGNVVELSFEATRDAHGEHLEGSLQPEGGSSIDFAVRVLANDTGTFSITFAGVAPALLGTAKLESEPNLAMLWSEDGSAAASAALFSTSRGLGCRGFHRGTKLDTGDVVLTWELVLNPDNPVQRGSNVVSLRRR